jgi:hypothetical protein
MESRARAPARPCDERRSGTHRKEFTMRKNLWLVVAAVGLWFAVPDVGRAGLITFDEYYVAGVPVTINHGGFPNAAVLTDSYAAEGVHFNGPNNGDGTLNGGAILYDRNDLFNFGVTPHSGDNVLAFNRNSQVGGFFSIFPPYVGAPSGKATDPETITFDSTQSQVSIWAAGGLESHQFLIQGFDANNSLVSSQTLTTQNWSELTVSGGGIQSVVLSEIGGAYDSWVYDDLSFTPDGVGVVELAGDPSGAPEPGSLVLLGIGGFGLAGWRWRMAKR